MYQTAIGIDISKATFDVALLRDGTYELSCWDNNKEGRRGLHRWLKKRQVTGVPVCLEATGRYGEATARFLHERNYPVSVANPARVAAYGASQLRRNRDDRSAAMTLAHFRATQEVPLWTPPSAEIAELRALTRQRAALKSQRTQEINRRKAGELPRSVLSAIKRHIAFIDREVKKLEEAAAKIIKDNPELKRRHDLACTIKGIGPVAASTILAEVPDVSCYSSAKKLACYAGLVPAHQTSGTSVRRRPKLSKKGNKYLRTALYMPALSAMRFNPIVKRFAERLAERGKTGKTLVIAAMRKLLHIVYGVLKHGRPFDPEYTG